MARAKDTTPAGHGEVLTRPDFGEWAARARENAAATSAWDFELCGRSVHALRAEARADALDRAGAFSRRLGVPIREGRGDTQLIVMTGHQPEFYHPGIWIKDFLLQRLADETGAAAVDLVVDSDGFDSLEIHSPCFKPEVRVCRAYLAVGTSDGCYACTPVPSDADIALFCEAGAENLSTLPAPALAHHFAEFCRVLRGAARDATDIAELVTFARRRYEVSAGSDYLELPVSAMSDSRAFATLVAHLARHADQFAAVYNSALADHRVRNGLRSSAQPFPDLRLEGGLVELPFWHLGARRETVWARTGDAAAIVVEGETICDLSGGGSAPDAVLVSALKPAPKALALTLYARLFVADWFIHGVGGGRYDQVTDEVIRRYFGVEPPAFGVASMTMYLPLGAHVVTDAEVDAASQALNRLKHNPDQVLDQVDFDSAAERTEALRLAAAKARLVADIAAENADKKVLGKEIRDVNDSLVTLLGPYQRQLQEGLDELLQMQAAAEVLTDRTYPFCLWSPSEVADKAR
jgi:hypothetical protein